MAYIILTLIIPLLPPRPTLPGRVDRSNSCPGLMSHQVGSAGSTQVELYKYSLLNQISSHQVGYNHLGSDLSWCFVNSFLASLTNTMTMDTPTNKSSCNKPPKKDPGGIGFIDDMGGGVDGLMSCTESLGFESSDERIDIQGPQNIKIALGYKDISVASPDIQSLSKARWRKDHHREVKKFPPPLSSFNRNGQPSFFLRSVSSDGRLELTEVRVDRPEILRASREDGRLRLLLIREDEETLEEEEEDDEEEEETLEEEERFGEWKVEGFRRCNEMMGHHDYHHQQHHHHHHQHNHMHVWSQQCVPTR